MIRKIGILSAVLAGLVMIGGPAFAHHGSAGEDTTKVVTVKGTVTDFQYINPHTQIYVDVKDENGNVQNWNGELSNTLVLHRAGWNSKMIKPGDQVLFNPEDRYEVEVQGEDYLILRERDIHAVASERVDDGTGLYL